MSSLCGAVLERRAVGMRRRGKMASPLPPCERGLRVKCKRRAKQTFRKVSLQNFDSLPPDRTLCDIFSCPFY